MKKVEYRCDRCGAVFTGHKAVSRRVSVQRKKDHWKLRLFRNWMSENARYTFDFDEMDLCVDCRKDFDNWLNGVEVK